MGTRSRIGIELSDHTILSVYCHWDGYPEHNGKILAQEYRNRQDVQELIDGGGISSLRASRDWNNEELEPGRVLYYTERGEDLEIEHSSFDEFVSGKCWEEYAYLYDLDGNWKCYRLSSPVELIEIPD